MVGFRPKTTNAALITYVAFGLGTDFRSIKGNVYIAEEAAMRSVAACEGQTAYAILAK